MPLNPTAYTIAEPSIVALPTARPKPRKADDEQLPISADTLARAAGETSVIRGFMSFPTDPPPETILAGNGQIRITDMHMWNAPAGEGKSVGMAQTSMAWALGLPYFGIYPSRPLKILHCCGEDDESTLGQCREGFLKHSQAITGRKLTAKDLKPLDEMVRTDFTRQFTGMEFVERLERMLTTEHADLVIINPLLSFIGGPIVEAVSSFLRELLGPALERNRCAALISHHTCKLNKDSWGNMDLTYSGIGGGEVANIPRSIFTLVPTKVKGLRALHVSKRKTVGWKNEDKEFTDHAFFQRTDDPTRPAWLPVSHAEAAEIIATQAGSSGGVRAKKATVDDLVEILSTGAMRREPLLESLMKKCGCGFSTAKTVLQNARLGSISDFNEKDPETGKSVLWFCLPQHRDQWVKNDITS